MTQARNTFVILVVGLLLLQIASIFVVMLYWDEQQYRYSPQRVTLQLMHTWYMVRGMSHDELATNTQPLGRGGLAVTISAQPAAGAKKVFLMNSHTLHHVLMQQGKQVNISIPLHNKQWLNIRRQADHYSWVLLGCGLLILLLLAGMLSLCAWTVKRLAMPLTQLVQAAHRFGQDVQAPPLPETGPDELQAVIRAYNQMQERIRRLLHDRTQMLAAISHDLRTPLTRLQLRAEYLQGTPQYEKALGDLREMEQMIESILSFSRDYARSDAKERFDMNALLATLCDDLVDAGHEVHYDEPGKRTSFFGDLIAIKRALTNVIENAIKYGQSVEVSLTLHAEQLHIKVKDRGPGIPVTEMENIFKPFYRLDAARSPKIKGAGLGLAVAQDIIRAHQGDITLHNRQPQGLSVIITLPNEV